MKPRGFTLIEMLVVLAIITVITSLILIGQSNFNRSLLLTDTAYTMAFSARQAQSYGLANRKFGSVQNPGYGLHFDRSTLSSYILFADDTIGLSAPSNCPTGVSGTPGAKPGNCRYDTTDGIVTNFTFTRGFTISSFCGFASGVRVCSDSDIPLTSLDMVFTRPNTSSTITGLLGGSILLSFTCADVTLTDQSGTASDTVRISSLGEVSTGRTCQ